jgi:hypothetical protein
MEFHRYAKTELIRLKDICEQDGTYDIRFGAWQDQAGIGWVIAFTYPTVRGNTHRGSRKCYVLSPTGRVWSWEKWGRDDDPDMPPLNEHGNLDLATMTEVHNANYEEVIA